VRLGADMAGRIMQCIEAAVRAGRLRQPFSNKDFKAACPGFGHGTYHAFLWKHREGNPSGETEHFRLVGPNSFVLLRQP
jgi:hypothetical protein